MKSGALTISALFFAIIFIGSTSLSISASDIISKRGVTLFEFKSGGAYHISGFGEWIVTLTSPAEFSMEKKLRDKAKGYGTVTLTKDEKAKLWGLIDSTDIVNLKPPHRDASPDEVILTFRIDDNVGTHIREVLVGYAREREAVVSLVQYIGTLIEKYAGEKPVLL